MKKGKFRSWFLFLSVLAACFLISTAYRFLHEEYVVDQCLSGHHGSFDYSLMSCDLETNHPFVPYGERHPRDTVIFLFAIISLPIFLATYRYIDIKLKRLNSK